MIGVSFCTRVNSATVTPLENLNNFQQQWFMSCSYYVCLWGQRQLYAMSSAFQDTGWRIDWPLQPHPTWVVAGLQGERKGRNQTMVLHLQLRRGTSLPVTCPEWVTWVSLTSPGQGSRILPQGRAVHILSSSASCHTRFLSAALGQLWVFHPCQWRLTDTGKDRSGILYLC